MRVDGPALHSPEHPCNGHDEAPRDDVHVCRFSGTQRKTGATVTPRPRSRLGLARSQYVTVTLLAEGTGPNPTVRQHLPLPVPLRIRTCRICRVVRAFDPGAAAGQTG
jgi:hypothetical protein